MSRDGRQQDTTQGIQVSEPSGATQAMLERTKLGPSQPKSSITV